MATLRSPTVSDDVADRLTDAVAAARGGDLVALRPVIRSLAGSVVRGGAFSALLHHAIFGAHEAVLIQGVLDRFAPRAA